MQLRKTKWNNEMSAYKIWILVTLSCALLHLISGDTCRQCLDNDVYCVDESSYYLCMGGKPMTTLYTCPDGKVCTGTKNICESENESENESEAACTSLCNKCNDENLYTCVTKTKFGRCIGGEVVLIGSCENDSICSMDSYLANYTICIPTCASDYLGYSATCSNEEIPTTTPQPPTTVNVEDIKSQCQSAVIEDKYFYIRNKNDNECKTYIYCEKSKDDMEAVIMRCSTGYFNSQNNKCEKNKLDNCGDIGDTTSSTVIYTTD